MNKILRILHLEDDRNDAELVHSILEAEELHCDIIRVERRADFIDALEQDTFDLILADYSLPMFDGLTALSIAKEKHPGIPFILLSGMLGEELAIDSMKAGATDYVLKQRLSRLVPSVKRALRETDERVHRKKAEVALIESEEKFRNLMVNLSIGIALINPNMEIMALNKQMKEWFPFVDDSIRPKCYSIFGKAPKNDICSLCPVNKTFLDGQRHEAVIETETIDGDKSFRVISTPIRNADGVITNAIEMLEDVTEKLQIETEKKKLEEQLQQAQKMEAIGTLAGGIAHDFNNILAPILGYTEMALMSLPADHPLCDNLDEVLKAGERAKDLIYQILMFSRKKQQERKPIHLVTILKEIRKLLRSSLPSTIEIRQNFRTDSDTILGDPTEIHQIILNLCTNASHAMRENGGILEINLTAESYDLGRMPSFGELVPGNYLKLSVRDTGHGMDAETRMRIFEPYFTTKSIGEGTGLGLAVIHSIVKNYDGEIFVESEPGKGSTFHVFFHQDTSAVTPTAKKKTILLKGSEHILLVDDEHSTVRFIKQLLERLGYRVTANTSSIETLEIFRKTPDAFDLVISDMTMPGMTGKDLAKKIKSIRPGIPIVLCTGYSDILNQKSQKEIGVQAIAIKPLSINDISKIVRSAIDERDNA